MHRWAVLLMHVSETDDDCRAVASIMIVIIKGAVGGPEVSVWGDHVWRTHHR